MIVVHADAGATEEGTLSWMQNPSSRVSYHYLVGRDGQVYQLVDEADRAWHAGKSRWEGFTVDGSVNHTSVGVALANNGIEQYRSLQYQAAGALLSDIITRYRIGLHLVRGHNEVSPGRKTDPYDHFDWGSLYKYIGLYAGGRIA